MVEYQVFPDKCVSINRVLGCYDRSNNSGRFKESLDLFSFLGKNVESCIMTPVTLSGIAGVLRKHPYFLKQKQVEEKIKFLKESSTVKFVDRIKRMKKESFVEEFFNDFVKSQNKTNVNIGQVASRYRGLMADLVNNQKGFVYPPQREDQMFLAEVICLSEGCNNNYIPSYDFHFTDEEVSRCIEETIGIVTGTPASILKKIKQH